MWGGDGPCWLSGGQRAPIPYRSAFVKVSDIPNRKTMESYRERVSVNTQERAEAHGGRLVFNWEAELGVSFP